MIDRGIDSGASGVAGVFVAAPAEEDPSMKLDTPSSSSSESGGMGLPSDSDARSDSEGGPAGVHDSEGMTLPDIDEGSTPTPSWTPGANCGLWIQGKLGLGMEAQVLLANAYVNLRRLPSSICKTMLGHLLAQGEALPRRNYPDRLASALFGISRSTCRWVYEQMVRCSWQPDAGQMGRQASPQLPDPNTEAARPKVPDKVLCAMASRLREALAVSHWGHPDVDYPRAMERLEMHGLVLGSKYNSAHFVEVVELLGASVVRALTAEVLDKLLPSLGIRSDFTLVWDGVSIGARQFSRRETLYLIGVVFHDSSSHVMREIFLAGPSAGLQHDGAAQVQLLLRALANHPANFNLRCLQVRGTGSLAREVPLRAAATGGVGAGSRGRGAPFLYPGTVGMCWIRRSRRQRRREPRTQWNPRLQYVVGGGAPRRFRRRSMRVGFISQNRYRHTERHQVQYDDTGSF